MTVRNVPAKVRVNNVDTIVELDETEILTNKTLTLPVISGIKESWTVSASGITTSTFDVSSSTAFLFTGVTSDTWTPNFGHASSTSAATSVNTLLAVNGSISQSMTVTVVANVASSSHYSHQIQIDGQTAFTPNWQGGVVPGAGSGSASAYDAYTYTIIKTASATYTVFASKTKFDT
jgi:hypothetical protein